MKSPICDMLGIEFPLLAFTHCRDVVVEVSKAGGMGVLGAAGYNAETLEIELNWVDEHIDGLPYGLDLIAPTSMAITDDIPEGADISDMVPNEHRNFAANILAQHQIDTADVYPSETRSGGGFLTEGRAANIIDVAFSHPIKLIANALGVPPRYMLEMGKLNDVIVAALVGAKEHAVKQVEAGVDVLVVAGTEAGGHCGEVSTLVLVPEVCQAVESYNTPVLAAGGIVTGRQMAACMAMGAAGAWTGSMWLTTSEAETSPVIKDKYVHASSRQTVRSKARTGKYSRQLRSPWTDAWESEEAPEPLPMPLQSMVSEAPLAKVTKLAESGHQGAKQLATSFVGQGVGLMNSIQSTRQVVYEFKEDYLNAIDRLNSIMEE
ncbi:MAG TPA: nitronate monooxygenase [Pseudomonadales bacterium]|jgi:NAD(P)H-dependent flavin oxidoreductase YrpB (nitropropane dioxygenase family)|nr:monooxygenase [Gammaproteobacteria bacterium]MDP6028094.1 nitronate monooxygenase [Pseudomonadales bacterium]MBP20222.1 monooxygenase [Gammaproteobacteria bacterium]MDP6315239.1 nitronate monooxygenase [Pseudomonadales bacterium]MDP7314500.1 nitronate monooxygenase [Pseudomonadales bacterium]|tara:strand:+ start:3823 stop:4953 length:1131 start_codon:yes stop_codon:yes gene_type:complete